MARSEIQLYMSNNPVRPVREQAEAGSLVVLVGGEHCAVTSMSVEEALTAI